MELDEALDFYQGKKIIGFHGKLSCNEGIIKSTG